MRKFFVSQPMHGLTMEEILKVREFAKLFISLYIAENGEEFEIIDTIQANKEYIAGETTHPRLWYLGNSIAMMSNADMVIMMPGWKDSAGCVIECEIASQYDIPVMVAECNASNLNKKKKG